MNDRTGEIRQLTQEEVDELNARPQRLWGPGKWVPLTEQEARIVEPMSRAERRKWLREARRGGKR